MVLGDSQWTLKPSLSLPVLCLALPLWQWSHGWLGKSNMDNKAPFQFEYLFALVLGAALLVGAWLEFGSLDAMIASLEASYIGR